MARKTKTIKKDNGLRCGKCSRATWVDDFNHKDFNGEPICKSCPVKGCYVLRNQKACDQYEE